MVLKKFIDDVSVLAVEQCLVRRLPLVLSSDLICDLSDDDVQRLAVESPDIAPERLRMTEKLRILQEGLTQLTTLDSGSLVYATPSQGASGDLRKLPQLNVQGWGSRENFQNKPAEYSL